MKEKEIIDKLKELQNNSFEWQGGEDLIDFIKNLKKENEKLQKEILDKDVKIRNLKIENESIMKTHKETVEQLLKN